MNKGWCNNCHRYQTLATRKTIHKVPGVLMLTTAITNTDQRRLWATPGWLPEEIGIIVDNGQFFCFEGEDLKLHLQRGIHNITVYTLTGLAANIEGGQQQRSHLVAMANGKEYENPSMTLIHLLTSEQLPIQRLKRQERVNGTYLTTSTSSRSPRKRP